MSRVDTNQIWLALGDFYDLFPTEERVYWSTFWEAYSDVVADLWGLAFQVDRAKSLFKTSPTFERRTVLLKFSNLVKGLEARFRISRIWEESGLVLLRGFVPRDLRTFTAQQLPTSGLIRVGVDQIAYTQVNTVSESRGYVREATFVLSETPGHDYADDPEFNDSFPVQSLAMRARIGHAVGDTVVDAVVDGTPPTVNTSGVLVFGVTGVNREYLAYSSVTILGNRYVFTLAPGSSVPELDHDHVVDDPISVYFHDTSRWGQALLGLGRVEANGEPVLAIDNQPTPAPSQAVVKGKYALLSNVDFDVSVTVTPGTWDDPVIAPSSKQAVARINIGGQKNVLGIRVQDTGLGPEHYLVSGVEGSETTTAIDAAPSSFEARFKRLGNTLEFLYRDSEDTDFTLLSRSTVSGGNATLDMVVSDPDTESESRVRFDEVTRRAGEIVGNQRLEEFFLATATYPYVYDLDQAVTEALELLDRPRARSEELQTVSEITDDDPETISARGPGEDFEPLGVPESGTMEISGTTIVYDKVTRTGDIFEFQIRGKLDPDIVPVGAGTQITVSTNRLETAIDYNLPGDGTIELKDLPTRDRMWAEVAQVDVRHVQNHYGRLVDLDSDISTQGYLNRVQGTWSALFEGPAFDNVHSGLQLAMALPAARISGTVVELRDEYDGLGRLVKRVITILGDGESVEQTLNPSLYPYIDWTVNVGEEVEQYQALTNGVEILDVYTDPVWHERFPGVDEIERFNTFGVFVAIEALSADADYLDALRFALRIKPTYTKLVMRFLLTSGDEDLSQELEDDLAAVLLPHLCEDMTLPEGDPPEDMLEILRLGDGHKLGQGLTLGGSWAWHYETLGTYTREGPYSGDGSVSAGGDIFTTAGAHTFVATDVGKNVHFGGQDYKITHFLTATTVRVLWTFAADESALDWELRDYLKLGAGETLGEITGYKCDVPSQNTPDETVYSQQIVTVAVSP